MNESYGNKEKNMKSISLYDKLVIGMFVAAGTCTVMVGAWWVWLPTLLAWWVVYTFKRKNEW